MLYRVQPLPPEIYQKLLIINPPPRKEKHVAFTDLNEIRTFRKSDSPRKVSGLPAEKILREEIKHLRRKIKRLEQNKENSQMQPIRTAPVTSFPETQIPYTPGTERSVTSPYRPVTDSAHAPLPKKKDLPPPPANVQRALATTPERPARQPVRQTTPPPEQETPPSRAKRFVAFMGAVCAMCAVPAIVSIIALGPAGLALAAGVAVLGFGLIGISSKMK